MQQLEEVIRRSVDRLPAPIADACTQVVHRAHDGHPWSEWGDVLRVFEAVVRHLAHIVVADLAAGQRRPAALFHHVENLFERPLIGQILGLLDAASTYFLAENLRCAVPRLIPFLHDSRDLLQSINDHRRSWAHATRANEETWRAGRDAASILVAELLERIAFLEKHPLVVENGRVHMAGLDLTPLVIVRDGRVLSFEEWDRKYRDGAKVTRIADKALTKEFGRLLDALRPAADLDATLDWNTFRERALRFSRPILEDYREREPGPDLYVWNDAWEGPNGFFARFLASDRTLLALSGAEGAGKSSLVARLAESAIAAGDAVWFTDARRFTFATVSAQSENPFPRWLEALLHSKDALDATTLKRIAAGAPPGRRLLLIFDGIDEIGGTDERWNCFIALRRLLEWSASLRESGAKVVLTFRRAEYERYEELDADLLPAVDDVAWSPSGGWLAELGAFDAARAQVLFERLQRVPEKGAAPAMSWETLIRGAGDHAAELTSNPLLFLLFLRAHHGLDAVREPDPQTLFEQEAEILTKPRGPRSWWRTAARFVRNGNVSEGEQVLADLLHGMAERGMRAVVVQPPGAKASRRDRRIDAMREQAEYRRLREAGMIEESHIAADAVIPKAITTIALASDLALPVIQAYADKVTARRRFLVGAWHVAGALIGLPAFAALLTVIGFHALDVEAPILDGVRTIASRMAKAIYLRQALPLSLAALFSSVSEPRASIRTIGARSYWFLYGRRDVMRRFVATAAAAILPPVIVTIALVKNLMLSRLEVFPILGGLLGLIVLLLVMIATRRGHIIIYSLLQPNDVSIRLIRAAQQQRLAFLQTPRHRRYMRAASAASLLAGAWLVTWALIFARSPANTPPPALAMTWTEWQFAGGAAVANNQVRSLETQGFPFVLGLVGTVLILYGLALPLVAMQSRRALTLLSFSHAEARRRYSPIVLVSIAYAAVAVGALATQMGMRWQARTPAHPAIARLVIGGKSVPEAWLRRDRAGRIVEANLRDVRLARADLAAIYDQLDDVGQLALPHACEAPVDLSRLRALVELHAPPQCFTGLEDAKVKQLHLEGPGNARPLQSNTVTRMSLRNIDVAPLHGSRMPILSILSVDDVPRPARMPSLGAPNVQLQTERIDWLLPDGAPCIVTFTRPTGPALPGIGSVERMWIFARNLDPAALRDATQLRGLAVVGWSEGTEEWARSLREQANALPRLEVLDLRLPDTVTARGKTQIARALDELVADRARAR